jgi:hypothetical protein
VKHGRCTDERAVLSAQASPYSADSTCRNIARESSGLVGCGIVNARGVTGTLGCVARTRDTGSLVFLTASHMLFGNGALAGQEIRLIEEGRPGRMIGRSLYGKAGNVGDGAITVYIDCAVGSLEAEFELLHSFPLIKETETLARPRRGAFVSKQGAASGCTLGIITGIQSRQFPISSSLSFVLHGQVVVQSVQTERPFATDGDSGALVRDEDGHPLGLIWAICATGETLVAPIAPILFALNLCLPCEMTIDLRRDGNTLHRSA